MPSPLPTPADQTFRTFFRTGCGWADSTKRQSAYALNRWAAHCARSGVSVADATTDTVADWLESMATNGATKATLSTNFRAIRGFYTWAAGPVGAVDSDPTRLVRYPGDNGDEGRHQVLTDDLYHGLVAACDRRSEVGRRDRAILSLLYRSGLRRGEITVCDLIDYDQDAATLLLAKTKTKRSRLVPLAHETVAAIDLYVIRRRHDDGPLFRPVRGNRLSPDGVSQLVDRARQRAGIDTLIGVHSFRRAFAIDCKRQGMSDPALQSIAGWRSSKMVARYTASAEAELAHQEYRDKVDRTTPDGRRRPRLRKVV